MSQARSYVTIDQVANRERDAKEAAARQEANLTAAINRFAWAVRDLRALGLAGEWNVRLRDGEHVSALTVNFTDDARAQQASDAIWGDMK